MLDEGKLKHCACLTKEVIKGWKEAVGINLSIPDHSDWQVTVTTGLVTPAATAMQSSSALSDVRATSALLQSQEEKKKSSEGEGEERKCCKPAQIKANHHNNQEHEEEEEKKG